MSDRAILRQLAASNPCGIQRYLPHLTFCDIFCDQSAVAMRVCAWLASHELTLLSWSGATSRTTDIESLWAGFFLHIGVTIPQ